MANSSKSRFKGKVVKSILGLFAAVAVVIIALPGYLQKGLFYLTPDIDDYKIFANRTIKTGVPVQWNVSQKYNTVSLPDALTDSLTKYNTVAFLVIQNDSILFEKYWGGYTDTTISNSFSAAKSIVSLLVGCAINDGYIKSLDEKVKDHLPWLEGPHSHQLTIRNLLTMSSGSDWDESYNSPFSITTQAYYGNDLDKVIRKTKIIHQPGIKFNYRSGDTQIVERLLKKVTGMALSDYASLKLWQPLGAENEALWSLDNKNGIEKAYCCFNSTARDFARLGSLVLQNGTFNQKRIISENYLNEMITPADYLTDKEGNPVDYYGLFWWVMDYHGLKIPYARGILGQYIFVIPDRNAVIVRLGHKRSGSYLNHHPTDVYAWLKTAFTILDSNQ
ncbi:serine hydrolase domain-containing protein [Thermophagus sp. OGC60D27]|uniref:serine hydrolase domain-containing protein n=1 Tax=Thermophagus sp. OGC60D27 TaxID=3458415 RepID=UPI004037A339